MNSVFCCCCLSLFLVALVWYDANDIRCYVKVIRKVMFSLCNSANDVCFTVVGSVGESMI